MLTYLIVKSGKPITEAAASSDMNRGTPIESGEFFAQRAKDFTGINAAFPQQDKENDLIKAGEKYWKIPTEKGERYATTEVTKGTLVNGDALVVSGNKFVAAGKSAPYFWIYDGVYTNPFGVDEYIVERVANKTTPA